MARAQRRFVWADAQFVVYLVVLASLGFLLGNIHGCSRHSAAAQPTRRDVPFHLLNSISAYVSLCAGHASRRFSRNLGSSVVPAMAQLCPAACKLHSLACFWAQVCFSAFVHCPLSGRGAHAWRQLPSDRNSLSQPLQCIVHSPHLQII
jgi:hypothetical protein